MAITKLPHQLIKATGTTDATTFLRGDGTWDVPAGAGDVSKVGTPVNNQVGIWTGDGTIEGDTGLTFDGSILTAAALTVTGDLIVSGDTVTQDVSTLTVEDPLIEIGRSNKAADILDLGFFGNYDTSGSQDLTCGLFRDATDNKFHLFVDSQEDLTSATAVNKAATGYTVATLVANIEGLAIGTDVQAHDDTLDDIAALGIIADNEIMIGTGAGTLAYESGATARTSLGVSIGSDVQAYDAVLDDLSALTVVADNEFIVGTGAGTYAHESGATARTSLGLTIGTDVQAFDATLEDIAALGIVADNEVMIGTGAGTFAYESGATLRTSLGVDAAGTDNSTDVTLSGSGTYIGLTGQDIQVDLIAVSDLANGTDGELITWDAAGAPATVAAGSAGQVLTSNGAGAAPTMQSLAAAATWDKSNYVVTTDYDGTTDTQLTLPKASTGDDEANVFVYFEGLPQSSDSWTISGTTITFDAFIPAYVTKVEIRVFS